MANVVLLDTNLLILFAVGLLSPGNIRKHKRLEKYDETDFELLKQVLSTSNGLLFTPSVLAETSNLSRQVSEPLRTQIAQSLATLIANAGEEYVESRSVVITPDYLNFGLTDAVLLYLAKPGVALLTDDHRLYAAAVGRGHEALNFAHLRLLRKDFQ